MGRTGRVLAAALAAWLAGASAQEDFFGDVFDDPFEDASDFASDLDPDFEPDEIVALDLSAQALALVAQLRIRISEQRELPALGLRLYRLRLPGRLSARRALSLLRAGDPGGIYDVNTVYRLASHGPHAQATACTGTRCYGQTLIGWSAAGCGAVRIGMVDSAIDRDNPALAGRRVQTQRIAGSAPGAQEREHGTAVAALLVGAPESGFAGLLPAAELVVADVFSLDRRGQLTTDAVTLARGLDWVAGQRPQVINISVAGPDGAVLRTATQRLIASGIPLVAAAGNQGPKAPPAYPAAYPNVVAVTAVDRDLKPYARANRGSYVALAAPGVAIWTPDARGAGVFRDGTSFAAPFAAAAIAQLRGAQPGAALPELLKQLESGARDLGEPGTDPVFGWGLVQTSGCKLNPPQRKL